MPAVLSSISAYTCPIPADPIRAAGTACVLGDIFSRVATTIGSMPGVAAAHYLPRANDASILLGKQYLEVKRALFNDLDRLKDIFQGIGERIIEDSLQAVFSVLDGLNYPLIHASLTTERSIYYTVRVASKTFFLQHFLDGAIDEDDDETLLAIFEGERKLPTIGGTFAQIIEKLRELSQPVTTRSYLSTRTLEDFNVFPR